MSSRPSWQQTMLRIKDPKKSLDFYEKHLGMKLVDKYDFKAWEFSLYFLVSMKPGETLAFTPGTPEAREYLWNTEKVTLELTHNWGTEKEDSQVYHPGNQKNDGFGHIAFSVDDVYKASDELLAKGVDFKKKPDEGRMKGLAFAYDPDGYWVELVKREQSSEDAPDFALSQTMLRVKDAKKSLAFYTSVMGMQLVAERHYGPEKGDFSLYFLCNKNDVGPDVPKDPTDPEAMLYIKNVLYPQSVSVLELTHNHGTESDESFKHNNGNEEPTKGFGHIGYIVDDVYSFCDELEKAGVQFHKKPDEGGMKGLAFALDPDGYWIEIIKRGFDPSAV
eukprot:CAMPEP_0197483136 /NCGR_PEP_ID=MMETSP1309-20131121/56729_1 /TAXON_ID=464262 /ORGANISM="Genus nov. species nov., Strain RCC998" /LENGTH=332 /DNA_ID=CAMNT_0043025725 /DNA_START=96 /DNA_END=1094 /DNA_ORIENTATION=-